MTTDAAFLDAIRAEPDEDVHRLAYADWLMERDDPRGEFIRLQCDLAKLKPRAKGRAALVKREAELLALHRVAWTDRAFVAWLGHPKRACKNPKGHAFCTALAKGIAARCDLARLPADSPDRAALEQVRATAGRKMEGFEYHADTAELPLFENGVFRRGFIEAVTVEDWVVELFAEALFDLCILRELELNNDLADDRTDLAMEALVRVGERPELRTLDISGYPDDPVVLEELVEAPIVKHLTTFALLLPEESQDGAVELLADAPLLANLRRLDISCDSPSDDMLRALLDSPHLTNLTELLFQDADLGTFSQPLLRRGRRRFGGTRKGKPGLLFARAT